MKKIMISDEKRHGIMKRMSAIFFLLVLGAFIISGCNGGSSGAGDLLQGTFVDSPVQGLDYTSDSSSGVTDADGHFMYQPGEMMTFSIGDVVLGSAVADEVMTPLDFIDASERPFDETHPVATNMGRFMQALDNDGDQENGIAISDDVRSEVDGRMIDFHQSIMDFENDPDTQALFDTLNALNIPHHNQMWGMDSVDDVQQHMRDHLSDYMGRYMTTDMGPGMDNDGTMGGSGNSGGMGTGMDSGDTMGGGSTMNSSGGSDMGGGSSNDMGSGMGSGDTMGGSSGSDMGGGTSMGDSGDSDMNGGSNMGGSTGSDMGSGTTMSGSGGSTMGGGM